MVAGGAGQPLAFLPEFSPRFSAPVALDQEARQYWGLSAGKVPRPAVCQAVATERPRRAHAKSGKPVSIRREGSAMRARQQLYANAYGVLKR